VHLAAGLIDQVVAYIAPVPIGGRYGVERGSHCCRGGPLADEHRVVLVVEAESEDAVRSTLARDPWSETHLQIDTIDRWTIRLDGAARLGRSPEACAHLISPSWSRPRGTVQDSSASLSWRSSVTAAGWQAFFLVHLPRGGANILGRPYFLLPAARDPNHHWRRLEILFA
jgi:hypothetical protein